MSVEPRVPAVQRSKGHGSLEAGALGLSGWYVIAGAWGLGSWSSRLGVAEWRQDWGVGLVQHGDRESGLEVGSLGRWGWVLMAEACAEACEEGVSWEREAGVGAMGLGLSRKCRGLWGR